MVKRLPLFEELASTLESRTYDAVAGVPDVEQIAFRVNYPDESLVGDELTEKEDVVIGEVVGLYSELIPQIYERLTGWFSLVEMRKSHEDGTQPGEYTFVINHHHEPEEWYEFEDMPRVFTLRLLTSIDKWLQDF